MVLPKLTRLLTKLGTKPAIKMILEKRLSIITAVGKIFSDVCFDENLHNFPTFKKIKESNQWFTEDFVRYSLNEWSLQLSRANIDKWLKSYEISETNPRKCLGLIMAGNIPMVGFHDFLCGFICGFDITVKLSSKDNILMKWVIEIFQSKLLDNSIRIKIVENTLEDFDAIIATGSNNSHRYFDFYFGTYPHILRKNRNSVAILQGNSRVLRTNAPSIATWSARLRSANATAPHQVLCS